MTVIPAGFVRDLLAPRKAPYFTLAGAGIGLFSDVVDFFTNLVNRWAILTGFVALAAFAGWLCLKVYKSQRETEHDEAAKPALCPECNATRFGLFAAFAFIALSAIGQGESATAKIGEQLGLIQRDVSVIKETLEPQTIIDNPKSMPDHFNNAFVYMHYRRDAAGALREMNALYARGAPQKLDAAQLYFDAHSSRATRTETLAQMERLATEKGDPTLLILAARHTTDRDARRRLVERARRMTPELPYAWWDPMVPQDPSGNALIDPGAEAARLRAEISRIEKFQALEGAAPPTRWYYMPEMAGAGHYGNSAAMLAEQYRRTATTYEDMASGKFQRDLREKMVRERAKGL